MTKTEVINRLLPKARELNTLYGLHISMTIAQVVRESGWLKHAPGNNFLGIKAPKVKKDGVWILDPKFPIDRAQKLPTWEYINGKWEKNPDWFVKYDSLEDCMDRYAKILMLPRYKQTLESKDWWDSTNYVRLNGYATSPAYTNSLRTDILSNRLYQLDWQHTYNEPINPGSNFTWGETFSNVSFNGKKYYRVIEPYPEYWDNVKKLATQLQIVRFNFGYPIKIDSWFRIPAYNPVIGGAPDSQHLYANAADTIKPFRVTSKNYLDCVLNKTSITGIGIQKSGSLHLDLKKVKRRIWYY